MEPTQIVLIVFIVLLIIIYPIMMFSKNKKENQRMLEQANSLKKGDEVLTTSGVYGKIIDLHFDDEKKIVTIETGEGSKKGYISVDAYAIYKIFNKETAAPQESQPSDKKSKKEKEMTVQQNENLQTPSQEDKKEDN